MSENSRETQEHHSNGSKHPMPHNSASHEKDGKKDTSKGNIFLDIYHNHYKQLMIISILLLILSVGVIGYKVFTTGDFVSKGVTLKGGITLTVNTAEKIDSEMMKDFLRKTYPDSDVNVITFNVGTLYGFMVEASDLTEQQLVDAIKQKMPNLKSGDYSSELIGSSLGSSFFLQTLKSIFVAFVFMSLVVYLYFGSSLKVKWLTGFLSIVASLMMFYANNILLYILSLAIFVVLVVIYFRDNIPSFGIMLCAFSDILFTLAVFNLLNMKLNTAGVAAFLMLIGYSIDTDILMSVRVLKRKEGTMFDRIMGAMKTGMMMSFSALVAVLSAYIFTDSPVIKEIMLILLIGLIADIIFTWIQNAGILRWHLEKKGWR